MNREQLAQVIWENAPWQRKNVGDGHKPKPTQLITPEGIAAQLGQIAALDLPAPEAIRLFGKAIHSGVPEAELGGWVRAAKTGAKA